MLLQTKTEDKSKDNIKILQSWSSLPSMEPMPSVSRRITLSPLVLISYVEMWIPLLHLLIQLFMGNILLLFNNWFSRKLFPVLVLPTIAMTAQGSDSGREVKNWTALGYNLYPEDSEYVIKGRAWHECELFSSILYILYFIVIFYVYHKNGCEDQKTPDINPDIPPDPLLIFFTKLLYALFTIPSNAPSGLMEPKTLFNIYGLN